LEEEVSFASKCHNDSEELLLGCCIIRFGAFEGARFDGDRMFLILGVDLRYYEPPAIIRSVGLNYGFERGIIVSEYGGIQHLLLEDFESLLLRLVPSKDNILSRERS